MFTLMTMTVRKQLNRQSSGCTIDQTGAVLRWGIVAPPPQIQKLADCSDVVSEVPKCSKIQIFRGSVPDPAREAYTAPQNLQLMGRVLAAPLKNPTPALGTSGLVSLRVSGSNPLQNMATLLMIDFKCWPICSSYFFWFRRTEKMDSVIKGLMGQCPPPREFLGQNHP